MKGYRDTRLLEMLDYIDPKYIEKTKKYYKSVPVSGAAGAKIDPKKQIKYITALVAAVLLLSAFIPAVTYIIQNHLHFAGYSETTGGDTTLAPEITSEEITSSPDPESSAPETTEPEPTHETTEPLYDGTTAPREETSTPEETTAEETTAEETTAEETTAEETTAEETTTPPEPEHDGSQGLEYQIEGDHAVLVGIGTCTDKEIVVASTYKGLPVTAIGRRAIYGVEGVTGIVISDTVTHLDFMAISHCYDLESIHIPAGLTVMEESAIISFGNIRSITVDSKNPRYYSVNNCLIDRETKTLLLGCDTSIIPADGSIGTIAPHAFTMCKCIESITIPEGVTKIGREAFYKCTSLRSVELPESLITIESSVFSNCSSLEKVKLGGKVEYMGEYVFSECEKLGEIILPDSLSFLGNYAFQGCIALKRAVLSKNLETLDLMVFASCKNLESVIIPEGVKNIGTDVFSDTALKEIIIPASV
ncbi:MAG: leucine-rich repeat domain-containing protein, partial [Clostridia bacterium]|nr:leucine-rich repeat domain-containing protein [Clostridia bacterium]